MPNAIVSETLYPFTSRFLELDGNRLHYVDEGEGPTLLMVHGNPTWSFFYRDLIAALRPDYRVIAPDHIGCGLSDKPLDYPYRLATHIANLTRLIEHLELRDISLFVHDWGGPIGLGYAVEHPEHVRRMVVFNSTAFVTRRYPLSILACKIPLLGALAIRGLNGFAGAAARYGSVTPLASEVKAGFLAPYDTWDRRVAVHRFVQDIPLHPRHPSWQTATAIQDRLHLLTDRPMLICWGDRDPCFAAHFLAEWQRRFPAAEVHRFADAGHYLIEDAGAEILPLVEAFLGRRH